MSNTDATGPWEQLTKVTAERDDATQYGLEQLARAQHAEAQLAAVTAERDAWAAMIEPRSDVAKLLVAAIAERDEAVKQQQLGWERAAENYRAYEGAANKLNAALVQEQCADISGLKIKLGRQRTELRRLNKTLRAMWEGVRFSHRVDRDMKKAAELDAERTARKALVEALNRMSVDCAEDDAIRSAALALAAKLP